VEQESPILWFRVPPRSPGIGLGVPKVCPATFLSAREQTGGLAYVAA
jgi:hypothetical protein